VKNYKTNPSLEEGFTTELHRAFMTVSPGDCFGDGLVVDAERQGNPTEAQSKSVQVECSRSDLLVRRSLGRFMNSDC
jgi:hypothetical protein